jgi:hypothetical protein
LEAARRAHAKERAHQQSEIEDAGVNQQSLPDVAVAAEVHAAHAASLIQMGEGPFQPLSSEPQQAQSPQAVNAPTIAVYGVAGLFDAVGVGPHSLELFGCFKQRLDARRGVAVVSVLHGDADDRAGLEIDAMLGFVARASFVRKSW